MDSDSRLLVSAASAAYSPRYAVAALVVCIAAWAFLGHLVTPLLLLVPLLNALLLGTAVAFSPQRPLAVGQWCVLPLNAMLAVLALLSIPALDGLAIAAATAAALLFLLSRLLLKWAEALYRQMAVTGRAEPSRRLRLLAGAAVLATLIGWTLGLGYTDALVRREESALQQSVQAVLNSEVLAAPVELICEPTLLQDRLLAPGVTRLRACVDPADRGKWPGADDDYGVLIQASSRRRRRPQTVTGQQIELWFGRRRLPPSATAYTPDALARAGLVRNSLAARFCSGSALSGGSLHKNSGGVTFCDRGRLRGLYMDYRGTKSNVLISFSGG